MSLCRLAAQICAVEALRGRTLAGDNVRDSETGLIRIDEDGNIDTAEQKPFINVFCDDAEAEAERRGLMEGGKLTMTFEFGITEQMPLVTADGQFLIDEESGGIVVGEHEKPSTAGINLLVETAERQIRVALADPANPWAALWAKFMSGPFKVDSRRGGSTKNGVRFGARQLAVTGMLTVDPAFGGEIRAGSTWRRFLDALAASEHDPLVATFESLLGIGDPALDFLEAARRYGLATGEARALGIGPFDPSRPATTIQAGILAGGPGGNAS